MSRIGLRADASRDGAIDINRRAVARRRDPVLWLVVCGFVLIGAILAGTVMLANGFRDRALSNGERELENTVRLLSQHFGQQFQDAETVANAIAARTRVSEIYSSGMFRARMSDSSTREVLRTAVNGLSYMGDFTVIDENGTIINWSGDGPMPLFNVASRAYFQTLKFDPPADNVVIEPVQSYITGAWTTLVAHRLTGANGAFLGLLSRRVDPRCFEMFLQSMSLGSGAAITVFHDDGTVLARAPHIDGLAGQKLEAAPLRRLADNGARNGRPITSPIDHTDRIVSGIRIPGFPIIIMATKTVDDALADWRSQAILLAAAAALATAVIALMFALAIRQIVNQNRESEQRLTAEKHRVDTALNNMIQGIVLYDADNRIAMFNQRYVELFSLSGHIVKRGTHVRDALAYCSDNVLIEGDLDEFYEKLLGRVATGEVSQFQLETVTGRTLRAVVNPLAQGGWVATYEDISEHRKLEQERDRNAAFLREIIDHIPSEVLVKDTRTRRYMLVNRFTEQRFGLSKEDIVGKTAFDLFDEAFALKVTADDDLAIASPNGLLLEDAFWHNRVRGECYVNSRRVAVDDSAGVPSYLIHVIEDVTERRNADEKIAHLAHFDALTDLPNRIMFRERIEQELEQARRGEPFALLYIDIDEFKSINDSLGHHVGDELLKTIAGRIKSCVKPADLVARLGGDEFAVLLTTISDQDDVVPIVMRLYEAIRRPANCLGHQLSTDASIGIALAPRDGVERDQLTKNADLAMYAAKAGGRRTFRFFEPKMDASARSRLQMEQDLRRALDAREFEIHYQPLVGLADNEMTGCEALLRWHHPERGMVSPAEFIPLAEDTGLINEIGDWVLRTACAEAAGWPDHIRLAVNVSPVQLKSPTLALRIAAALAASGLASQRLEVEITEAVLIRDDETALKLLHQLHDIGVRIALDDFGTGYSSLSYLKRFPFDKIKIDRCFVGDVETASSSAIVEAVVNIASASHMTTTAEGVETESQRTLLRQLGCTEMQGYLFSPPKPAAELRKLFSPVRDLRATG